MGLLFLTLFICFSITIMLMNNAIYGWYMGILALLVSLNVFYVLPGHALPGGFIDLAADTSMLIMFLFIYTGVSSQTREEDMQRTESNAVQSLNERWVGAWLLVAYGLSFCLLSFDLPISNAQEVASTLLNTYIGTLGFVLLWRTWRLKRSTQASLEKR